jgi:hypothetical protein
MSSSYTSSPSSASMKCGGAALLSFVFKDDNHALILLCSLTAPRNDTYINTQKIIVLDLL